LTHVLRKKREKKTKKMQDETFHRHPNEGTVQSNSGIMPLQRRDSDGVKKPPSRRWRERG